MTDDQAERQPEPDPARGAYGEQPRPFRRQPRPPLLHRLFPVLEGFPGSLRSSGRSDVVAGVTVAALGIPAGMAYAELAGVPATAGLYALLLPTVAYALFGSSRQMIVGPEGSVAALIAIGLAPVAAADPSRYVDLAQLLAIMVGATFLLARFVRLGWIADYLSRPVLIGYIHGVVVVLIAGQLGKVTGIDVTAHTPIPQIVQVLRHLGDASLATLAVSTVSLAALLLLRRFARRVPGALIVVVAAIAASSWIGLAGHGVAVVGPVPRGLPSFDLPSVHLRDLIPLARVAVGIFLVSFSDEILTARTLAGMHGRHVSAEQELGAMGLANVAAGVTQGFPIGGSNSRTAVNDQMGAKTQVAGLVGAAAVALVLLFLTGPIQYLPKATLGALIIAAAIGLVDRPAWRALAASDRVELTIAAITTTVVVLVGVLQALLVAVALSVVDAVRRSATPHDAVLGWVESLGRYGDVRTHPGARIDPGVLVYRLDDRLFFANAGYVAGRIREAMAGAPAPVRYLVFDAEALNHVDATGMDTLGTLLDDLDAAGVVFLVARAKGPLRERLQGTELWDRIGPERFLPTVRAAVDAALAMQRTEPAPPQEA